MGKRLELTSCIGIGSIGIGISGSGIGFEISGRGIGISSRGSGIGGIGIGISGRSIRIRGSGFGIIGRGSGIGGIGISSSGIGSGMLLKLWLKHISDKLTAKWIMRQRNVEIKRLMIEVMGMERFCTELESETVDKDVDSYGHPRLLLRFELSEAKRGFFQAVRVVCPTTGRVYHLGVDPSVKTCRDAVASTFGLTADEYKPDRET